MSDQAQVRAAAEGNRAIWDRVYQDGTAFYTYPDENVVRIINGNQCGLDLTRRLSVLDIGFGSGNNLFFLARKGFAAEGVEIAAAAVEHVRSQAALAGLDVRVSLYDPPALPFADGVFDLVLSWNCMHYMGSPALVDEHIAECHRILAPGGTLLASTISRRHGLAASASPRQDGTLEVAASYQHDPRAGAVIVVPASEAAFRAAFSRFDSAESGHISLSLFNGQYHECYLARATKARS